jgi:valyl-tRNA synthetase
MLDAVAAALAGLRGVKSTAKVSMRTQVTDVTISATRQLVELIAAEMDDLAAAAKIVGDAAFVETEGSGAVTVTAEIVTDAS